MTKLAMPLALLIVASGCAMATPVELTEARRTYARANAGPAAQVAPSDLHKAELALQATEQAFARGDDAQKTIDLAYIAERTAEIAEAHAKTALSEQREVKAKQELVIERESMGAR